MWGTSAMDIRIMVIIITVTLILISLSIIMVIRTITAIIMIGTDDQRVATRRTEGRLTRKELGTMLMVFPYISNLT